MIATGPAVWFCRSWVRFYTRNLPSTVAADRRDELESDLWEHGNDVDRRSTGRHRYQFEVAARMLLGLPADLVWRRRALRTQSQSLREEMTMKSYLRMHSHEVAIALAALGVLPGASLLVLLGSEARWADRSEMYWVLSALALSVVLFAGVIVRARGIRPRRGTILLLLGAPAPSVAWFWFPPFYLLSFAILVATLLSIPRRAHNIPAPA